MILANNKVDTDRVVVSPECRCHPINVRCSLCSLDMVIDWANGKFLYECCHFKGWFKQEAVAEAPLHINIIAIFRA